MRLHPGTILRKPHKAFSGRKRLFCPLWTDRPAARTADHGSGVRALPPLLLSEAPQVLLLLLLLAALCFRAGRSVELTDEIHGIASVLNILQGRKPFVSSWDYHTGWCLTAPFYQLYLWFHAGGRTGIVRFSRGLYLCAVLVVLSLAAFLLSRTPGRRTPGRRLLPLLGAAAYVPFSLFQLSYNSLTCLLLLLLTALLGFLRGRRPVLYVLPGVLAGLICVNYPTMAAGAVLLCGAVFWTNRNNGGGQKALAYGTGLCLTGVLFFAWILAGSGPEQLLRGAAGMLRSPHELKKTGIRLSSVWKAIQIRLTPYYISRHLAAAYLPLQLAAGWFCRRRPSPKSRALPFLLFLPSSAAYVLHLAAQSSWDDLVRASLNTFLLTSAWILADPNLHTKDYAPFLGAILGFVLTYRLSSDNNSVLLGFHVVHMMTAFVSILAFLDRFRGISTEGGRRLARCAPAAALLLFAVPGILCAYRHVYRDSPVRSLTFRVESGVFQGLYTTPERAAYVTELEAEVSAAVPAGRTLCVATREPALYVMSEAEIDSPQTWDPQFLYRGYTSASSLLDWFAAMGGELPDVIAATSSAVPDFYDNPDYEIRGFLDEHYRLYRETVIGGTTIWLWERTD